MRHVGKTAAPIVGGFSGMGKATAELLLKRQMSAWLLG